MNDNHARLSPALVETIAGLAAGTASTLAVHPLDVIKTRLQSTSTINSKSKIAAPADQIRSSPQHICYSNQQSHCPPLFDAKKPSDRVPLPWPDAQSSWQCKLMGNLLLFQIQNRNPATPLPQPAFLLHRWIVHLIVSAVSPKCARACTFNATSPNSPHTR